MLVSLLGYLERMSEQLVNYDPVHDYVIHTEAYIHGINPTQHIISDIAVSVFDRTNDGGYCALEMSSCSDCKCIVHLIMVVAHLRCCRALKDVVAHALAKAEPVSRIYKVQFGASY